MSWAAGQVQCGKKGNRFVLIVRNQEGEQTLFMDVGQARELARSIEETCDGIELAEGIQPAGRRHGIAHAEPLLVQGIVPTRRT